MFCAIQFCGSGNSKECPRFIIIIIIITIIIFYLEKIHCRKLNRQAKNPRIIAVNITVIQDAK